MYKIFGLRVPDYSNSSSSISMVVEKDEEKNNNLVVIFLWRYVCLVFKEKSEHT